MTTETRHMLDPTPSRASLALLIGLHIITCCVSLIYLSYGYANYQIYYDSALLKGALIAVAAFSALAYLFLLTPFSFGYFVGFYFYTMTVGYLWLNCFSRFEYNHWLSGISAAVSMIAFLLPALFMHRPIRRRFEMNVATFDRIVLLILAIGLATALLGAVYSFKIVSLSHMYDFRGAISMPRPLYYLIGISSNALLPFAFAYYVVQSRYFPACFTLILLLLFYPITLNKIAFFTPAWLLAMAILTRLFGCRTTVVISLLLPLLIGTVSYALLDQAARPLFEVINLRMVATPSNAMDVYNDFFFHHPYTYFCQIGAVKLLVSCPYQDPLGEVMKNAYEGFGSFNASLFSTEGIASVGPLLAPISILVCGLVIGFANRLAAGLCPRFVMISGSVLPHILLNVPLTITLLSHGAVFLFALWYLTPRAMFASRTDAIAV